MSWWTSEYWAAYEAARGESGARVRELSDAEWNSRVIDLSRPVPELYKDVRQSYRSLISLASRDLAYTWEHATPSNFRPECMVTDCRELHRVKAGRETRPKSTWVMLDEWIKANHGLCIMVNQQGAGLVGYAYFVIHGQWAYYFSGVTLTRNVSHALIWIAMKELKTRVRWLEIGWMDRPGDDQKEKNIAFFKSGFGGIDIPARQAPEYWKP